MTYQYFDVLKKKGIEADALLLNVEDHAEFEKFMHLQYVREKLAESKESAANPDTVRFSHEDVWAMLGEKYGL